METIQVTYRILVSSDIMVSRLGKKTIVREILIECRILIALYQTKLHLVKDNSTKFNPYKLKHTGVCFR